MLSAQLVLVLASLLPFTLGHIALWDEGMYGWDPNDPNQSQPVEPLMNLPFSQWWFHGYINNPPPAGAYMNLPSRGTYHGEVSCNKALTSYGDDEAQETGGYACDTIGPMHTADAWASPDPKDVKGCGIAIAYESDVTEIQPEDFAVISVNYQCPWKKDVDFEIPSDLPLCPEGGCHCMWGWIHNADLGSEQMYFVGYRCNVTGATGTKAIPPPKIANKCDYPSDTSNCTVGAKQPHYWFQAERNNNPQGTYEPPFYNGAYGFKDGAQTDLFAGVGGVPSEQTSSSVVEVSSTTSIAASSSSTTLAAASSPLRSTTSTTTVAPSSETTQAALTSATTTIATSSTTSPTSSTTTSSATASPTSSSVTCNRRRRALSNLSSPDTLKRHQSRQARRFTERVAAEQDLGRIARTLREWREERERSGLGLRSLGTARA